VLTYDSKLGKWPVKDVEGIVATRPKYPSWRGLRVDYPSAREKIVRNDSRILQGVIVVDVAPGSSAAQAKLQYGNVITHVQGTPVRTPGEFHRAVQRLQGDVALRLYVDRGSDSGNDRSTVVVPE
jgi:serine protease Do